MIELLSAEQAVAHLKVSRQTLYAYVSRGLVRSEPAADDPRRRLYRADDIAALRVAKSRGRSPAKGAVTALDWGLPVLPSALSNVADGHLFYRGRDAVTLAAAGASLEDVARLLWGAAADPFAAADAGAVTWPAEPPPAARCLTMLAVEEETVWPGKEAILPVAARVVRRVTATLLGQPPSGAPIHEQMATAWGLDAADTARVRQALVLCADHELNVSTFTVRCVASTRASLAMTVAAGLAALTGPLHGGATARATALIAEAERLGDPARPVAERLGRGEGLPAFGHQLYPDGDPRATALLAGLDDPVVSGIAAAVVAAGGPAANLDFALAALEHALRLPAGAAFILFAAGRTVGWIAHALEQRAEGSLIRPRARYTGLVGVPGQA